MVLGKWQTSAKAKDIVVLDVAQMSQSKDVLIILHRKGRR